MVLLGSVCRGVSFPQGDTDREREVTCSKSSFCISSSTPSPWRLCRPSTANTHQNIHKHKAQAGCNLWWQAEKQSSERNPRCDSKCIHHITCTGSANLTGASRFHTKWKHLQLLNYKTPRATVTGSYRSAVKPNPLAMHTGKVIS